MKNKYFTLYILFITCSIFAQENIIETSGDVGIGTSNNAIRAKLHVISDAQLDSNEQGFIFQNGTNNGLDGGMFLQSFLPRFTMFDGSTNAKWFDFRVDTDKLIIAQGNNTNQFSRTIDNQFVLHNGKLGLSVNSPEETLHVKGKIRAYNSSADKYINLYGGNSGNFIDSYGANLFLRNGANSSKSIILREDGNVGIGLTNPISISAKIHVASDAAKDSNIHGAIFSNETNDGLTGGVLVSSFLPRLTMNDLSTNARWFDFRVDNNKLIIGEGSNKNQFERSSDNQLVLKGGNFGIGTDDTQGFKLGVNGNIAALEVKVAAYNNWADFVFKKDYELPTLKEVENHIETEGHLENIPSADEVGKNGFFLGEMDAKLLQKIEELTLYTIAQEKKLIVQDKVNTELMERLVKLEILMKKLN